MPRRKRPHPLLYAGAAGCVAVGCAVALYYFRRRYLTDSGEAAPPEVEAKEQETAEVKPAATEVSGESESAATVEPAPATEPVVAVKPAAAEPSAVEPSSVEPAAKTEDPSSAQGSLESAGFSCFLSHDWGIDEEGRDNHARVAAVHAQLTAAGLRCWFDEEQMQGDINSKMTSGIDDSAVVVCFVTSRYVTKVSGEGPNGDDDNCKLEFDYTVLRKGAGRMVAVVMEPSMKNPSNWVGVVGAKLGTKLYVDLAAHESEGAFTAGVRHLAKEIQARADGSFGRGRGRSSSASSLHPQPASLHPQPSGLHPTPAVPPDGAPAALAHIPPEVPELPESVVERPELIASLKQSVLRQGDGGAAGTTMASLASVGKTMLAAASLKQSVLRQADGSAAIATTTTAAADAPQSLSRRESSAKSNATIAVGMGGVGKTMIAAAFVHDEEVRAQYDRICWVSLGQEPDIVLLQQTLHIQLTGKALPEAAKEDERVGLQALKEAVKAQRVLLVLDDAWAKAHAALLNFVERSSASSSVVATTRIRALLDGASEVQCGVLPREASLELLLRAGGCSDLIDDPPPAALEAVEMCGHLPLALGLAGGIIAEMADSWQDELVPLLKDEFEASSVEARIVTASLHVVPAEIRAGVEALFSLFAVFAEDRTVPMVVLDVLAPLIPGEVVPKQPAQAKRQLRKWVTHLLKANILFGSVDTGLHVHDLVRDCMVRAAEAREGGLRATQREVVARLLAAFDGPAMSYVASGLAWHVRQARQPTVAVQDDALLMGVLTHEVGQLRKMGVKALGPSELHSAAAACDAAGEFFMSAQLVYAVAAVRGMAAGAEFRRAWASLQKLEEAGKGSAASRALESRVLNALLLATEGGFAFGTAEHSELQRRIHELSGLKKGQKEEEAAGSGSALAVRRWRAARRAAAPSKEVMEAEIGLCLVAWMAVTRLEGLTGYAGPVTSDAVPSLLTYWGDCGKHLLASAAVAIDETHALVLESIVVYTAICAPRQHTLPQFSAEDVVGKDGALARSVIQRYDFDKAHPVAKQFGIHLDTFLYGLEPLCLLLWWGDTEGMRAGVAKVMDGHKQMLARVEQSEATVDGFAYEVWHAGFGLVEALLAAGDLDSLREFMANSLTGAALSNEKVRTGMLTVWGGQSAFGWKTDDGHCCGTLDGWLLTVRGLAALVAEDTEASRGQLRAWLPPAAELLRITEHECMWRGFSYGASHPAVLCARLHGERLGAWDEAAEVAEGVLRIESFHPMLRIEALRLLGSAHASAGRMGAACEAGERAASEAAAASYVWMELLALRDVLRWSSGADAAAVQSRQRAVASRVAPSPELDRVCSV